MSKPKHNPHYAIVHIFLIIFSVICANMRAPFSPYFMLCYMMINAYYCKLYIIGVHALAHINYSGIRSYLLKFLLKLSVANNIFGSKRSAGACVSSNNHIPGVNCPQIHKE